MIKILHVAKPLGGVGVYINLLCNEINAQEFHNEIACNFDDDNIDIKNSNKEAIKKYHFSIIREIQPIKDFKCLVQLIRIIKRSKPNIIHCHSAKAGILGRLAGWYSGIPVLYTPHAYSYLSAINPIKVKVFKLLEKVFGMLPSKTLACSLSEYNRTIEDLKFKKDKVLLWNNSISSVDNLKPSKFQNELPDNYICTVGRPSYQKNIELLIESIKTVKKEFNDIHLVILGVGLYSPSLDSVEKLIKKLNLTENVTLVKWIDRLEALSIVKDSMFYVSSSRYEGLPYAVIEALALSKPCVLTNVDGNKDLVEHEKNGYLVSENSGELADKILDLYHNQDIRKYQSENSYQKFMNEFNINENISKLKNIYIKEIEK